MKNETPSSHQSMQLKTMPSSQDFDEILTFLPLFTDANFRPTISPGGLLEVEPKVLSFESPTYHDDVDRFVRLISSETWSDPGYKPAEVGKKIRDASSIECANLQELKSMLTWCWRGERFCEGHLESVFLDGTIPAILRRLEAIRPA